VRVKGASGIVPKYKKTLNIPSFVSQAIGDTGLKYGQAAAAVGGFALLTAFMTKR
jgi:hypothetical protein